MSSHRCSWLVAVASLALLAPACGDDGGGGGGGGGGGCGAADGFHGIYEASSFLVNEAGCDAPGEERLTEMGESFFFVDSRTFFGQRLTQAVSCASVEDCRTKHARYLADEGFGASYTFGFDRCSGEGLAGVTRTTGFSSAEGICRDGGVIDTSLQPTGADTVVIETRARLVDYPADGDGFCSTDAAEREARDAPCSERETVTATRVAEL